MREEPAFDTETLLARLKAAEPRAFEELVIAYQHRVFGVAARMLRDAAEAEEVAQEVFLRVHRGIGAFRGESKLSTWLYAITSRLCLNRLAAPARRTAHEGDDSMATLASHEADPATAMARRQTQAALRRAIAALSEERRIVVVLRDLEGLTYEEIATALDLEPGTVRSRLHRARTELKEKLEKFLA